MRSLLTTTALPRRPERNLEVGLTVTRGDDEIDLVIIGDVEEHWLHAHREIEPEITAIRTPDGAEWTGTLTTDEHDHACQLLAEQYDRVQDREDDAYEALREDRWQADQEARHDD